MGRNIVHLHGTVAPLGGDVHFPFIAFVHTCEGNLPAHDKTSFLGTVPMVFHSFCMLMSLSLVDFQSVESCKALAFSARARFRSAFSLKFSFQSLEVFCLTSKEIVACSTETLKDLDVHLLWGETDGFPLCLQFDNLLRMALPVGTTFILFGGNGFHFLAEYGLTGQIVFLLGTQLFEMLLMALVDNGRSSLEACPYLFARSSLATGPISRYS